MKDALQHSIFLVRYSAVQKHVYRHKKFQYTEFFEQLNKHNEHKEPNKQVVGVRG
jgi:hypothetical protein